MPINIDTQRSQTRVGHIRIGEQVPVNGRPGVTRPAGRDMFRFTSPDKSAMEALKAAYGGVLRAWKDHPGEWELMATTNQISVIVDTRQSVDENFTQYDGKTRSHHCDGLLCKYVEIKRGRDKKITSCEDRGIVPCLCDPEGLGSLLEERDCDLSTTLRVILPTTKDITLWQLTSKGVIFNKEANGMVETLRGMGLKHAYCLLTIHKMNKTVGDKVTNWVTARLTLDANPPDFVKALMENTMEGQARRLALQAGEPTSLAAQLPRSAPQLPQPKRTDEVFVLATQALKDGGWDFSDKEFQNGLKQFKAICIEREHDWALVYLAARDARCEGIEAFQEFAAKFTPETATGHPESVEAEVVEAKNPEGEPNPFAEGQSDMFAEEAAEDEH